MTPEQENVLKWKAKVLSILEDDYDPEGLMDGLALVIEDEMKKQTHREVKACLDSVIESLRQSAMDYYVSTK